MAVTVYDRNGQEWVFHQGGKVETDPDTQSPLLILSDQGEVVGGFNSQSWTHFRNPMQIPVRIGDITLRKDGSMKVAVIVGDSYEPTGHITFSAEEVAEKGLVV
ncbi:hypothetical protein SEA_SWISSCHEESE_3 [Mycobacterium phage SwissCheese]|nr:hypothetical protein SEA_CORVO_4 [Mycobacterium phage Corvo]AVJ49655.1 hypothetical protein SEA_FORSYTHEAST_3 [Mycobacterium phage Forsytheast]AXH45170.1 hypothetical protein SEA_SWISSCHEESE_3 [Mycobacterium phage SwissCheese]AXH46136.1 hypothetical protein SEA_MOOSE_3 [Mycobacterium phage Moose]QAY03119.1 hypothetical protein SEA_METALQZJ_4 [Mycobacterium phage MetalQZJ]QNJ55711.1 hypothetical protein SEA_MARYBETH_4 [Mycobacterium phage MaryBeth]